ncbi:MAG: ATP-binding protein [Planctomycetota bacterium]
MAQRILVSTSAGKDSTLALHELLSQGAFEVEALLTTVTGGYERISMHGVRRELLQAHAEALGFPLHEVRITPDVTYSSYEQAMYSALTPYRDRGVRHVLHGDIFLEDLRSYRDHNLATLGMAAVYPLWGRSTAELARTFCGLGYRAFVTCIDTEALPASFVGRAYDAEFLRDLPPTVDPCGENGEFHTFVVEGPVLRERIPVRLGEVEDQGRFVFRDLLPA